jgi:hypothetical protein
MALLIFWQLRPHGGGQHYTPAQPQQPMHCNPVDGLSYATKVNDEFDRSS